MNQNDFDLRSGFRLGAVAFALLGAGALGASDASIVPKQLAGPPSEFSIHQPAPARDAAIHSTSVLLPVALEPARNGGWQWQGRLALDGDNPRLVVFDGGQQDWSIEVANNGAELGRGSMVRATESGPAEFGIGNALHAGMIYRFEDHVAVDWTLKLQAGLPRYTEGYVLAASDSPWELVSWQAERNQFPGQQIMFHAESEHRDGAIGTVRIERAWMRVTGPDGAVQTLPMRIPTQFSLVAAETVGRISGSFTPAQVGEYLVQVSVEGRTPEGAAFQRSAQHVLSIIDNPISILDERPAAARAVDDTRISIDPGLVSRARSGLVHAYAEVWGRIGEAAIPVAWIGGMVDAARPELSLDTRWIALAGVEGPFELRNLRISDADHFIPLAQLARRELAIDRLPEAASQLPDEIDEAMRMGPRPEWSVGNRAGARLLLVHGYCSGNVWGNVAGQFGNASIFQDFNQNRSHNQFALQILNFGNQFDSYGIVAHSQGGAAATHLYTFYWSGLDNASGSRLIQSVGTPYQGTALAGNLAALGSVFGVGCGTNSNLTYSGASSWLSGIPSWARSKVNYYTTSFATAWWRWDYCNAVSDLVLSDPEDGTTERAYGQLSGAVNRGHKTGWCHTSGMRDPAQTTDSSRNSTMNVNAAR